MGALSTFSLSPVSYSSSPFDLAGYEAPPQSTLTSRLTGAEEETATRSTAADIINSIGNIILGGIVLARTPTERLPQPATSTVPVQAGTSAQQAGQVKQAPFDFSTLVFVGLIVVIAFLAFRMAKKAG